jgi:TonB family protein
MYGPSLNDASLFPPVQQRPNVVRQPPALPRLDAKFPYAWYLRDIQERVNQIWLSQRRSGPQPTITFQLSRTGAVTRAQVQKSSGDAAYDALALGTCLITFPTSATWLPWLVSEGSSCLCQFTVSLRLRRAR